MAYSNNDDAITLVDISGNPIDVISGSLSVLATKSAGSYGGQIEGRTAAGEAAIGNPILVSGDDGISTRSILVDSLGRIITAPAGSSSAVTSSLAVGQVQTASTATAAVRATAYTEQTTNAQRSIVSANAADSSVGTGARTVQIKYYDQDMVGPFFENITLNGTTAVNTVNTNICYIEQIYVLTAGSGGTNAGIISLRTATGGGGTTFASIAAGANQTFYAHHYVAVGKVCYITGLSIGHTGTTVGSGCVFVVRVKDLLTANSVEQQVSDFIRLYGQSSTITRNWSTAIRVAGGSRIVVYGTPEAATALTYRAALDLFDQ